MPHHQDPSRRGERSAPPRFAGVRAVTFDCWSTLIFDYRAEDARRLRIEGLARIARVAQDAAAALLDAAWLEHFAAWDSGVQFGAPGMAAWILKETDTQSDGTLDALTRCFEEAALDVGVRLVDGAVSTLKSIRDSGRATALVCDTGFTPGRVVRALLGEHGLAPLLDAMAFSNEVGATKPSPAMFATALDAVGGGPAVHIGDLRRTDVAGARAMGLGSVRFRGVWDDTTDYPDADVVIDDLSELPALLG